MAKNAFYPFSDPKMNFPRHGTVPGQKIGRMLLQPSSVAVVSEGLDELLRDYNQALVSDLGWMSRRDIKKQDMVDVRPILDIQKLEGWQAPNPKTNPEDTAYAVDGYWYCYIPCFSEGVLHVNSGRYIWWKIEDLDFEKHRMAVWLQDFIYYDMGGGWQPGVRGLVCWKFQDPEDITGYMEDGLPKRLRVEFAAVPEQSVTSYTEIYKLIDIRKFHWSQDKLKIWNEVLLVNAQKGVETMLARTGMHNLDNLAGMFTTYMLKVNRILDANKKAMKSRPVSDSEHETYLKDRKESKAKGEKPKPERRVRNVGPIVITSRVRPKPNGRSVADYKKPAWKTRKHLRTLPSGKKTWVKASIHRRKALLTPENANLIPDDPAPVTIRIRSQDTVKDEKTEEKTDG